MDGCLDAPYHLGLPQRRSKAVSAAEEAPSLFTAQCPLRSSWAAPTARGAVSMALTDNSAIEGRPRLQQGEGL